eukprot:3399605-Amphidinium_carterae.1
MAATKTCCGWVHASRLKPLQQQSTSQRPNTPISLPGQRPLAQIKKPMLSPKFNSSSQFPSLAARGPPTHSSVVGLRIFTLKA